MGLPNSSLSQGRRVDVYSWRESHIARATLDIDTPPFEIRTRKLKRLPNFAEPLGPSGTLIVWSKCDRFAYAPYLFEEIKHVLGRIFRKPLNSGLTIQLNGVHVVPFDPLFRNSIPPSVPYGEPMILKCRLQAFPGKTSDIVVSFAELPIEALASLRSEDKRRLGISKGAGVSILRLNREISYGWYFLGTKRKENYDDWWRAEVCFTPECDELFGVTNNKQQIRPTEELLQILVPHMEGIARTLNFRVRKRFEALSKTRPASVRCALHTEIRLPAIKHGSRLKRPLDIRLIPVDSSEGWFYDVKHEHDEFCIFLNRKHPLYERIYSDGMNIEARTLIELLIISSARVLLTPGLRQLPGDLETRFRAEWGKYLAAYLGN
jgi:hypothetical protein